MSGVGPLPAATVPAAPADAVPTAAPAENWKRFTKGPEGSNNWKKHNTTLTDPKETKNSTRRRGNLLRGLTKQMSKTNGVFKPPTPSVPNTKNTSVNNTRKKASKSNRIDRLLALFKGALNDDKKKEPTSIDIAQYTYVLTTNPTDLEGKKNFVKIMESLEAFPKETEYEQRIAMLTPEFTKKHGLEKIGMKIDKTEKGAGNKGQNIQTYRDYTDEELTTIIRNYKQTIFDDVIGLFIILTVYILFVLATNNPHAFREDDALITIKSLIEKNGTFPGFFPVDKELKDRFLQTPINGHTVKENLFVSSTFLGIAGFFITLGIVMPPIALIGFMAGGIIGGFGVLITGHKISEMASRKLGDIEYSRNTKTLGKNVFSVKGLLKTLFELITHEGNEQFVGSSEIQFIQRDYDFLKEFNPMFREWYTDTELYNFILLFTRERFKEALGDEYNQERQLPQGWHEYTEDGKTYYNSFEFSKNEEKGSLNRYKLVSWVKPMAAFGVNKYYNADITIYPPSDFSHDPKTPQQQINPIQQKQLVVNSGPTIQAATAATAATATTATPEATAATAAPAATATPEATAAPASTSDAPTGNPKP